MSNNHDFELAELTGSVKQIAWAERIREDVVMDFVTWRQASERQRAQHFAALLAAGESDFVAFDGIDEARDSAQLEELWAQLRQRSEANWWINNREWLGRHRIGLAGALWLQAMTNLWDREAAERVRRFSYVR